MKKPELLAPAGNLKKLKIALAYGADAVYGGVSHFSLRTRAGKEFSYEDFAEGVRYTHALGRKIYITINGFPFNSQLKILSAHIEKMAALNPDGFIVAAPGVIKLAKQIAPNIPLHLSTQANVLNVLDAEVFAQMGVKRIIAAREISLKDLCEIKKHLPQIELEIFIHGSMCFAYSGRCLLSALQNGRVPNRGSCANDCRFDYEYFARNPDSGVEFRLEADELGGTHIFNAKDLNLSAHLPQILQSGVIDSLKIEGRTKSSFYVGLCTRTYRAAINDFFENRFNAKYYEAELNCLQNRGYFDGYLVRRPYERTDSQNLATAISESNYRVNAEVSEDGLSALCRHTIREGEAKEIIAPNLDEISCAKNEFGEIFEIIDSIDSIESDTKSSANNKKAVDSMNSIESIESIEPNAAQNIESDSESNAKSATQKIEKIMRKFLRFKKIKLANGREVAEIHSGNENPIILPFKLPPFSFLRQKI